jgi:ribonuclease BN (tRNA processing enzyme)
MLEFIGNGSAFNSTRINTSAFIKQGGDLLLLDCGETVYAELKEQGILEDVKKLDILITHYHPDHIGSLGTLIFYAHFILKIRPRIYTPSAHLVLILTEMGVDPTIYDVDFSREGRIEFESIGIMFFESIRVIHAPKMEAYAYKLVVGGKRIYYSGDTNMIPKDIVDDLHRGAFDLFYQDVCTLDYPGNVHLSVARLTQLILEEFRDRVWCMHLDERADEDVLLELGFNVTTQVRDV